MRKRSIRSARRGQPDRVCECIGQRLIEVFEYTYDAENRLTQAACDGGGTYTYVYTAAGERVSAASASTTYYGYDVYGAGGYEHVTAEYDSAGTRQARYTQGPAVDEPLGVLRNGSYYDYQRDALGSATRLTDSSGGTTSTDRYDAFGAVSAQAGSINIRVHVERERGRRIGLIPRSRTRTRSRGDTRRADGPRVHPGPAGTAPRSCGSCTISPSRTIVLSPVRRIGTERP